MIVWSMNSVIFESTPGARGGAFPRFSIGHGRACWMRTIVVNNAVALQKCPACLDVPQHGLDARAGLVQGCLARPAQLRTIVTSDLRGKFLVVALLPVTIKLHAVLIHVCSHIIGDVFIGGTV